MWFSHQIPQNFSSDYDGPGSRWYKVQSMLQSGSVIYIASLLVSVHVFFMWCVLCCRYYCSLSAALAHVTTIRPWVRPNTSFLQQLVRWEAAHTHHHQDNLGRGQPDAVL